MIWDILIKIGLAGLGFVIGWLCFIVGYSRGFTSAYKKLNTQHSAAAPELLESCIGLIGILTPKQYSKQFPNIYRKAQEAIKKATVK